MIEKISLYDLLILSSIYEQPHNKVQSHDTLNLLHYETNYTKKINCNSSGFFKKKTKSLHTNDKFVHKTIYATVSINQTQIKITQEIKRVIKVSNDKI